MRKGVHAPTYRCWQNMKNRCGNPKAQDYVYYGGRGIFYPHAWEKYEGFLADMGEQPISLTLDRINGDLSYSKANCRWATRLEQSRNRAYTRDLTFKNRTMKVWEWAEELGIKPMSMHWRLWQFDSGQTSIYQLFKPNTRRRNGLV